MSAAANELILEIGMIRSFLENAATTNIPVSMAAPGEPTAEYLTGFSNGWVAGEVAGLALALSCLTGESVTALIDMVGTQAAVEFSFPFELHMDDGEGGL